MITRVAFGTALALTALMATGSAAAAAQNPVIPDPGNEEIRIGSTYEDAMFLGVADEPQVSPYLFDPVDAFNCEVLKNPNHMIVEIDTWEIQTPTGGFLWPGGDTDLLCGTATTSGWWHIQSRHEKSSPMHPYSWTTIREAAKDALGYEPSATWDDFMWNAVMDSFEFPFASSSAGNNKVCLSTTMSIWEGTTPVDTFWVNTVAARDNMLIVTAYPSDNQVQGPDCVD